MKKPVCLMILDGFGHAKADSHNAITHAQTPHWDQLLAQYPHSLIDCSGEAVGLPKGQMGNSEVGHMHMGAGRLVPQDLSRINQAIADDTLKTNPVVIAGLEQAKKNALHIIGLLSPGGVHSHEEHIFYLIKAAKAYGVERIYLHAICDGRDTPPKSVGPSLNQVADTIATICGRYYAMDRDQRWERTEQAYQLIYNGQAHFQADDAQSALKAAYERGETDEFIQATVIKHVPVQADDVICFMNFRADRARQLTQAFIDPNFDQFPRAHTHQYFLSLTRYAKDLNTQVIFPNQTPKNSLGEVIANAGLSQLRIAETEKYAHVTFFFNGGIESPFAGEDRLLIPSPKVATYDLKPEMSAYEVTAALLKALEEKTYDFILLNFANADMVGHSGNFEATVKAIEVIDDCIGKIVPAIQKLNGEVMITADHGNAECMYNPKTQQAHTAHTNNLVPFVYIGRQAHLQDGNLQDIAPTICACLGISPPAEMTGNVLIKW